MRGVKFARDLALDVRDFMRRQKAGTWSEVAADAGQLAGTQLLLGKTLGSVDTGDWTDVEIHAGSEESEKGCEHVSPDRRLRAYNRWFGFIGAGEWVLVGRIGGTGNEIISATPFDASCSSGSGSSGSSGSDGSDASDGSDGSGSSAGSDGSDGSDGSGASSGSDGSDGSGASSGSDGSDGGSSGASSDGGSSGASSGESSGVGSSGASSGASDGSSAGSSGVGSSGASSGGSDGASSGASSGSDGSDGSGASSGSDGSDGSGASSGSDGSDGSGASSGSDGSDGSGSDGSDGSGASSGGSSSGSDASDGSDGSDGGSDKSTAIVPAAWSPTGYAALYVAEMPDVRFDDVLVVRVPQVDGPVTIDPRFVAVCNAGSIEVCGVSCDAPVPIGARAASGRVRLTFAEQRPDRLLRVVIRLSGVRKGFGGQKGQRFAARTAEQFDANNEFIDSAYPGAGR